jgi:hypothetical protein
MAGTGTAYAKSTNAEIKAAIKNSLLFIGPPFVKLKYCQNITTEHTEKYYLKFYAVCHLLLQSLLSERKRGKLALSYFVPPLCVLYYYSLSSF